MTPPPRLPFMRLLLLASVLSCLTGCSRKPPEEEPPPVAPVKWMEARTFFISEWTDLVGTTQPLPDHGTRVSANIEGRVLSVLGAPGGKPVSEGKWVKKGDVIVQLDDRIAQANRDKLEAAQQELKQQIAQAELVVKSAELDLAGKQEANKNTPAGSTPLVAPIDMEKAKLAVDDAKSKRRGAELHEAAGAKELEALNKQLELYKLTAPIDGRLGRILVVPGQTLAVGTPVAEVINIEDQIDVLCFVPPAVARKLKEGQTSQTGAVDDMVLANMNKPGADASQKKAPSATGKLVYIADQAEVDTGNFAVKVRFPNKGLGLRGNNTLRVRVLTAPGKAALTLPESAIREDEDPPTVVVVDNYKKEVNKEGKEEETGVARILRVKTGMHDRVLKLVEIVSVEDPEKKWQGDLETARFVTEKGNGLRSGDLIKLEQDEDEEPPAAAEKKD
ncbi:MAG TPA: efflux RND transporter periplasmic adaptor subunit [Gemmataceae bacterium]|jgi:RND family efflux transporter MFP subunit|nr:efflux RND transporter periplasmic adaptor subunit [Gemmataceae bacterium]